MDGITQIVEAVLAVCGGISIIGGAALLIAKGIKPALAVSKRLETVERHVEEDYRRMEKMEQAIRALCGGVMALLCHAADNNSTGVMKEARDELQDYLINK
jgi:hypothetical protein